uniref:Uncharacterized protein n=1 Tax=Anguilla anguilla TaxID=7936 RepID=A0A0E9PDN6_ANGAN
MNPLGTGIEILSGATSNPIHTERRD